MKPISSPTIAALPEDRPALRYLAKVRWLMLLVALALASAGLATIHSASSELSVDYMPRQAVWVALGGRQWLVAAFLGAILVKLLEGWLSEWLGPWWLLALGCLFVASVVIFPGGVIGSLLDRLTRPRAGATTH